MILIFWMSLALLVYIFVGYPALIALWSAIRPNRWRQEHCDPSVSIVFSAYNEAATIASKIANLLSLDYRADRLEIVVGSDGSTDRTPEQLLTVASDRLRVFLFPQRHGKAAVLNALIPRARGEIIVLCDVRQMFDAAALRALTRSFADPRVGAVSGELVVAGAVNRSSGLYWRYEKFIRSREAFIESSIGATGAIYAIRKELFEPIPPDTILDDVLIPMRVVRKGYRVIVDREARAVDSAYANAEHELTRKVRTLAGNFQLFAREPWLLSPFHNRQWWQTISHKALRLVIAPLQVAVLLSNVALLGSPLYNSMLVVQSLFYAGAITGSALPRHWKRPVVISFPSFFCLLSWATVLGFLRSVTGRQPVTWQKATVNSGSR